MARRPARAKAKEVTTTTAKVAASEETKVREVITITARAEATVETRAATTRAPAP